MSQLFQELTIGNFSSPTTTSYKIRSRVNVLAIENFRRCYKVFLKRKWRESVCHVNLGELSHVPKSPRIGSEVQIRGLG